MKKIIILMMLVSMFTLSSVTAFACDSQDNEVETTITLKIINVSYSKVDNSYYAYTENDSSGKNWGLFITQKPFNEDSLKWLNKYYKTLHVEVTYVGDLENDEDVELIRYKFVKAQPIIFKTSQIISKVSYSEVDKVFYIYTQKASNGTQWVVSIDPAGKTLKQLQASLIGHTIDIYYVIDEAADGEEEIIRMVMH